jgi:hypothetical protein
MKKIILPAILTMLFLSSCYNSKIPFTYELKSKLDSHNLDVRNVQFYNSDRIVIRRVVPLDEAKLNNGEISLENGKTIDEVIINKETPGVCKLAGNYILGISFEDGNMKTFDFELNKMSKTFDLKIKSDDQQSGRIAYDSAIYILQPSRKIPILLIEKDDKYIYQLNQRVLKGQRVN